jgi:hypothetical protein
VTSFAAFLRNAGTAPGANAHRILKGDPSCVHSKSRCTSITTAKAHGYGNEYLPANTKVNTDAMSRTTQLVQEGFVKIAE